MVVALRHDYKVCYKDTSNWKSIFVPFLEII